ncbi:hypothetical protein ACFWPK_04190 [Nocardia sp. NPDC058519]|uniref:hypothetical protein n=1 Tax=Nocardia sp. NPDC058519 TaxID=3346535 RepID=UPI0036663CBA
MDDGDPISPDEAALMAAVIDAIEPDTAITAEHLHRHLVAEISDPPSLVDVRSALAILRMPHVGYRPGESSAAVLDRLRDMLHHAEHPPTVDLDHYLGNLPY